MTFPLGLATTFGPLVSGKPNALKAMVRKTDNKPHVPGSVFMRSFYTFQKPCALGSAQDCGFASFIREKRFCDSVLARRLCRRRHLELSRGTSRKQALGEAPKNPCDHIRAFCCSMGLCLVLLALKPDFASTPPPSCWTVPFDNGLLAQNGATVGPLFTVARLE